MIDLSKYPKHNWEVMDYGEFVVLKCKKCKYQIQERFIGNEKYLTANDLFYPGPSNNVEEVRKCLLSCEEVIIKNIIE